jgi:hypothetical protein
MLPTDNDLQGAHQTATECDFEGTLLTYYRRAGKRAAWALVERMADASEAGCYREDHVAMVRDAVAALPTRH